MKEHDRVQSLFQLAAKHNFSTFSAMFSEMEAQPGGVPPEAWLIRAQIKLYAADASFVDDLEKGEALAGLPSFPCLAGVWRTDSSNRFIAFCGGQGALSQFTKLLPDAEEKLGRWYGDMGSGMARQMLSEICYFTGNFGRAAEIAQRQYTQSNNHAPSRMLALFVLFRCHLASGNVENAGKNMLEMISLSQKYPECLHAYEVIRAWSNLTTGWSGDTPRFETESVGRPEPVLDDRVDSIRNGIAVLSPLETAFADYASASYDNAYTMRQHYMDVFFAMYWFEVGDQEKSLAYFEKAYAASASTGLIAPFAECGKQMLPLLEYLQSRPQSVSDVSDRWIAQLKPLALQYEEGIEAYRDL